MARRSKEIIDIGGSVESAVKLLEKQYGRAVVSGRDNMIRMRIDRLPSWCFSLDFALGGGIPIGRTTLISGAKASAKTTMALRFVAAWQELTPGEQVGVWIDTEAAFDPDWAQAAGVDLDRLIVVTPKVAEQSFDYVAKMFAAKETGLIVLDSIAAMVPVSEMSSSGMDQQRADAARLLNKLMRVLSGLHNAWQREGAPKTVILVNQLRQKLTTFGTAVPLVEPGGLGQIFHSALIVRFRRTGYEFLEDDHAKDGTGPSWAMIAFRVEHSKVSPPLLEGEFRLCLRDHEQWRRTDTDDMAAFLVQAQRFGLLRRVDQGWALGSGDVMLQGRTREETLSSLESLRRGSPEWRTFCALQRQVIDAAFRTSG